MMVDSHVQLRGSERLLKEGAHRVGDVDPSTPIEVTVTLRGPDLPDLRPGQSMTREEIESRHGASPADIETVKAELQRFGLEVEEVSPLTRSLKLSGTAEQMEQAFHAQLGIYKCEQGQFRGREGYLEVPASLEGLVTGVFGLDERRVARRSPRIRRGADLD